MCRPVLFSLFIAIAGHTLLAQQAKPMSQAGPGVDAHWPTAAKNGFGTSTTLESKVWFTLTNGVLTEVFYPTLDSPNTQSLRFMVCKLQACVDEERDMTHSLKVLDPRSLSFQQTSAHADFSLTKNYTTDVERSTVLIEVNPKISDTNASLYVVYDPSLNNSGMHDTGWSVGKSLVATEKHVSSALVASEGFTDIATLFKADRFERPDNFPTQARVENGNVIQIGKLPSSGRLTLALAFGATPGEALLNARRSLQKGFATCRRQYEAGWHDYLSSLNLFKSPHVRQLNMAAMNSENKTGRHMSKISKRSRVST